MDKLKEELKLTNQEAFEKLLKKGVKNAFEFITQKYISKEDLIAQIKSLKEEPTREGIINIINKL